jgi:hypothetical protein
MPIPRASAATAQRTALEEATRGLLFALYGILIPNLV